MGVHYYSISNVSTHLVYNEFITTDKHDDNERNKSPYMIASVKYRCLVLVA